MNEPIILTVHQDAAGVRTLTVDAWPRYTMFDDSLFGQSDHLHLSDDGTVVTITVSNGSATYQLLRGAADDPRLSIPAQLISSRLSDPACQDCGIRHAPGDKSACIEGHGDD